ncbi:hypothetical protein RM704_39190 [Streptomyces sp. DSM 3412]|uniref:Uncharacterized protein n=1 Tax=Streptomyces gottesmaniae TaxID=3075518 RepID=A0ABU2ZCS3_9ACTN|nr:hypothetical protein [Streptomyces sp. DSM 3412]MDT0573404.1 hypothetical protein [Streptomyces sp. DSM 3412]
MFQSPAPPLAPMTPNAVISAFTYLRAVQPATPRPPPNASPPNRL